MKRSPLVRRTPLKRTPFITKRRKPDIPKNVRDEVKERSEGDCEVRGPVCTGRGEHMHHRTRRSQLGKHGADNLIHSCQADHTYIHVNVAWAKERGFLD